MEILRNTVQKIAKHAIEAIDKVDEAELEMMISKIMDASSVFIVGTGRSELIGKAFAMRLMHLGFKVHVVGDVTTPAIRDQDCLIAISGSGETKTVTLAAETSRSVGATVVAVTATPESTLTGYSDVVICIPSKTKEPWKYYTSGVLRGEYDDLTPMGTLFEDSPPLFLDGLIAEFMSILGKREKDLKERHAIIE